MAQYTPLFYRGAPASIPQVVAHIQRTLTEEDPNYTPLRQRMPPASIPEIVAHIQEYLAENVFLTTEDLGDDIAQYIADHPEIVGVFTVNGAAGNVLLDASDIPVETGEDPTVAGAISYLSSQLALLVANAVMSVNGVSPDDSHDVTLTGANIPQDANTTKKLSETFGPAASSTAGSKGLVPAPAAGDENKVLSGSGSWITGSGIPTSNTVATPIATTLGNLQSEINPYVETTTTASRAYSIGEYFTLNGVLRKATSVISAGNTITDNNSKIIPNGGLNDLSYSIIPYEGNIPANSEITLNYGSLFYDGMGVYLLTCGNALSVFANAPLAIISYGQGGRIQLYSNFEGGDYWSGKINFTSSGEFDLKLKNTSRTRAYEFGSIYARKLM